jgi:16S rRNA processing protein RimM
MTHQNYTYIGYITKTKGLKGELQLFFEFDDYEELDLDVIFIEIDRRLVPFFVDEYSIHSNSTGALFLEDVDHIDKAQPLLRKKVYFPTDKLPVRDPDDFRWKDLVGFTVTDSIAGELGEIREVHEYPQQFVASVLYKEHEILFPLNDSTITEIQQSEKKLFVELPDGLIALYLGES